jgi:hypothetical protein
MSKLNGWMFSAVILVLTVLGLALPIGVVSTHAASMIEVPVGYKGSGDFTGLGRDELLFYNKSTYDWTLDYYDGSRLVTAQVGNTTGFGNISSDQFWTGQFTGDGRTDILFYNPGDGHWFVGTFSGMQLSWTLASNTSDFGNISSDPFWTGQFTGDGHTDILFYNPGDGHWFVGTFSGTQLYWTLIGTSPGNLAVSVTPYPVPLDRAVSVEIVAQDAAYHWPVAGTITINNFDAFGNAYTVQEPTNTPFTITFHAHTTWTTVCIPTVPIHCYKEVTGVINPSGTVSALGYLTQPINFGFPVFVLSSHQPR